MATQGQRRAESRNAVRQIRKFYRTADTMGERVERELDRLVKRKTLITPDQLRTLMQRIKDYIDAVQTVSNSTADLAEMIALIPS